LELIARAAQQNGDLDKAIDLLIKAVQVNPFEPVFYLDIAKIYQSRRDNQQAIEILESGVRTNPYHFDLLHHLGLLYYQQGAYKQADICLRQAAAIRPEDENLKRMLSTLTNANIIQEEPISNMADFEE
jgi:tetratricopeptide (TPR) repeat protein